MRVNGTEVNPPEPAVRLLDYLRSDLALTGAKEGCGMGECGSCTVLVDGNPVCSCLVLVGQLAGTDVVTVEGLASADGSAHARLADDLRSAFVECHAVQCGFCIPGVIVSARAVLASNPAPDDEQVRTGLEGNLCRCTGYSRIVRAVRAAGQ